MSRSQLKKSLWILTAATWVIALGFGFRELWAYASSEGERATAPATWPHATSLGLSKEKPTLVMVAHPLCPCTRASLAELAKLMADVNGRLAVYVVVGESKAGEPAMRTATFRQAAAIPGVHAIVDRNGALQRQLGAATSGQVFLYDSKGALRFSGGITASRGHEGPSLGRTAIVSIVNSEASEETLWSRVFGCQLQKGRGAI